MKILNSKSKSTAKVSKSSVMKRAWAIFNQKLSNFKNFSECLSRAWKVEKENLKYRIEKAVKVTRAIMYTNVNMNNAMSFNPSPETTQSYYNSNAYKGD